MVAQSQLASTFVPCLYNFTATDVTNAAGTMVALQSGATEFVMPFDGSVVGVTMRGSGTVGGTLTTGTLTPIVMINGATVPSFGAPSADIMVSQRGGVVNQDARKPGYRFTAGQTLGLSYEKSGTVAPSGALDVNAQVVVLFENVHY